MRIRGIPGRFVMAPGGREHYRQLARYHYSGGEPATMHKVLVIWHHHRRERHLAAVAVVSWPVLNLATRTRLLGWRGGGSRPRALWLNRHVRTISRVVVHPLYRSLGLAGRLVRRACRLAGTPVVEAVARMGTVHPLFIHGGMHQAGREPDGKPYFIHVRRDRCGDPGVQRMRRMLCRRRISGKMSPNVDGDDRARDNA